MRQLTPVIEGKPVPADRLSSMEVTPPGQQAIKIGMLFLRLKSENDKLLLEVLSVGEKPLVILPMTPAASAVPLMADPRDPALPNFKIALTVFGKQALLEVQMPS